MKYSLFLLVLFLSCKKQNFATFLPQDDVGDQSEIVYATAATSLSGNLVLESTFEDETAFKKWSLEVCRWDAIKKSADVARKGSGSARFEFKKTDVTNYGGFVRAELRQESPKESESWYGFSNFLPNDFASDPIAENIAQWHEVPDWGRGESWRSPPISFGIRDDRYYVHVMWASATVNTNANKDGEKKFDLGPVDKNKWNDWVFHIKFSYKSDGILEIWKNNVKVVSHYGANSFNDLIFPYFKIGIHKWGWNGWAKFSPSSSRVLYYDEVRVGNRYSNKEEVSPQ
jgi:hypothetical protein